MPKNTEKSDYNRLYPKQWQPFLKFTEMEITNKICI